MHYWLTVSLSSTFHLRNVLMSNMIFRAVVFGRFLTIEYNRNDPNWHLLLFFSIFCQLFFFSYTRFFLTNWHKLYQWLHKARQEVFISISFGTGWFPTLGLRDISTSPYGVVLETVQGKTTSFIYRALFNWIQTFLRRQKHWESLSRPSQITSDI